MSIRTLAVALTVVALLGCPQQRGPEAPSPNPIQPPDTALCDAMCKHIGPKDQGGLGCEEGEPVYDSDRPGPRGVPNKSCADFCKEQQDLGVYINPRCVMLVTTCDAIEAARQKDCR